MLIGLHARVCYMRLCVRGYLCPAGAHSATPKVFNPHRGLRQQYHCQWGSGILGHMRGGMLCVCVCYGVVAQDSWNMYCCHANSRMTEYMFGRMSLCVCVWDWTDFCRHVCQRISLFSCISDYAYYLLCLHPPPTGTYTHARTHIHTKTHIKRRSSNRRSSICFSINYGSWETDKTKVEMDGKSFVLNEREDLC